MWIQLTAATVDGVNVGGRDALVDDGVKTEESSPGVAGHAPESLSGAGEKCRGNGNGGGRLHGGYLRWKYCDVVLRSIVVVLSILMGNQQTMVLAKMTK